MVRLLIIALLSLMISACGELGTLNGITTDNSESDIVESFYLQIVHQPLLTKVSEVIAPGITVHVKDNLDNIATTYSGDVTLSLSSDPSSGTAAVAGTLTQSFVNGVATFNDLDIDTLGEQYQFKAETAGLDFVKTRGFDVVGSTALYRSVGTVASELATGSGTSFTITIAGSLMTVTGDLPSKVGIGDAVEYDIDANDVIDAGTDGLAFIYGRIADNQYIVKDKVGGVPTATTANDTWEVDRSYSNFLEAEAQTDNTRVTAESGYTVSDLIAATNTLHFAMYADAPDASSVLINGFVNDASSYVRVFAPNSASETGVNQRHSGSWDDSKFYFMPSADSLYVMRYWILGLRVEGIQFSWPTNTVANSVLFAENLTTGTDLRVSNCLFKDVGGSPWQVALSIDSRTVDPNQEFRVYNNIFYGFSTAGITIGGGVGGLGEGKYYIYNNTFVDMDKGVQIVSADAGTHVIKNNIAQDMLTSGFDGSFDASSDYNISNKVLPAGTHSFLSSDVVFTGAEDYRLDKTDTMALGKGEDLSADTNLQIFENVESVFRSIFSIGGG